ncbi:DUF2935 domain-containing protein [Bacillus timonensis]|uniref:DUF2935 domain-containing protein n=1 Tax=Bacillus timonensis TaxID=1033734 RepID=A0A4V3V8G4_9BACI|nr:DUF2935 domain-containing protein [Bacillus timonensis]THE15033.1 DUF2935 domain-containing protein [Bacillus timonensis]
MNRSFQEEALFETQFWMQVLGDHSRFIHDSLAPSEKERITKSKQFITVFDRLLNSTRESLQPNQMITIIQEGRTAAEQLRQLKLDIIKNQLVGKVKISLSPSFINHMVNELEEWLRVSSFLVEGKEVPPTHALHHHLIWLLDAAGHAGGIVSNLDRVEKDLIQKSEKFVKDWEDFYLKAVEMVGFLRTSQYEFPALSRFNHDVEIEMKIFKGFLEELEEMELNKEILGVLTPLMADHMAREECYYLIKLAKSTKNVNQPNCDPTKRRVQE